MANKPLKSIQFPGLSDTYTVPQVDNTLAVAGAAADAKKVGDEIDDVKQDLTQLDETKANVDGSYDNMTVGNAKQLVATVGITDKVPYNFRTSGGSADIGDREVDKIVGGTIVWNQLCKSDYSNLTAVYVNKTVSNDEITITAISTETVKGAMFDYTSVAKNHVYLASALVKSDGTNGVAIGFRRGGASISAGHSLMGWLTSTDYTRMSRIAKMGNNQDEQIGIFIQNNTPVNGYGVFKEAQFIDLTAMFGSTIADYVYGLEQSQAGSGVAWFKKLFPKPYYAYDAGSLQSVQTSEHKMVGFNQWDEEWELGTFQSGALTSSTTRIRNKYPIPVLPNTTYYIKCPSDVYIMDIDADISWTQYNSRQPNGLGLFTTANWARYIYISPVAAYGATYHNDICINLSWDGERDGEYEAYKEYVYPLDDSLTLRGIPKLDAGNNLYYDGDVYEADGTVTRKYGIVDLGTLTWSTYTSESLGDYFYANFSGIKYSGGYGTTIYPMICSKYPTTKRTAEAFVDKTIIADGTASVVTQIQIKDSAYESGSALKTALNGVYLVYELAEPTTESADPFQTPQEVDDFGTEEYVDAGVTASTPTRDVAVPVGHETVYQANLRAKLEMAPDSPGDGDGDYIVRQTGGVNAYVLLEKELPTAPSTDGTYHLEVTIDDGEPTLAWVANE